MTTQDKIAAGVIATLGSLFPFLVVLHVLTWTGDTVAACMLVVNNAVALGGLIFQSVQHRPTVVPAPPAPTPPVTG